MKKLLIASCILSVALAGASIAATSTTASSSTGTTYTEKFIQKHTQGIVNKEKALRAKNAEQRLQGFAYRD